MTKRKTKRKTKREREGLLPDQFRKRSFVTVERPRRAGDVDHYEDDGIFITDVYHVVTRRDDGTWSHFIEHKGNIYRLPPQVLERLIQQRNAIIKEGRSIRAQVAANERKARLEEEGLDA